MTKFFKEAKEELTQYIITYLKTNKYSEEAIWCLYKSIEYPQHLGDSFVELDAKLLKEYFLQNTDRKALRAMITHELMSQLYTNDLTIKLEELLERTNVSKKKIQ